MNETARTGKHYLVPALTIAYCLLVAYGTLFPLSGWRMPPHDDWWSLFEIQNRYITRTDLNTNFLVYVPLGLLAYIWLKGHQPQRSAGLHIVLFGAAYSFSMETLQLFLPSRVPSFIDLGMNSLGTFGGVIIARAFSHHTNLGQRFRFLRHLWVQPGHLANLGLVITMLWVIAELSPVIPTFVPERIKPMVDAFFFGIQHPNNLRIGTLIIAVCQLTALVFLTHTLLQDKTRSVQLFFIVCVAVFAYKLILVNRMLGAESLIALVIAALLGQMGRDWSTTTQVAIIIACALVAYTFGQLGPLRTVPNYFRPLHWTLFSNQIGNVGQFAEIVTTCWEFLLLPYALIYLQPKRIGLVALVGLITVFAYTLALEWWQQYLMQTRADVTNVFLACVSWTVPWLHPLIRKQLPVSQWR